MLVSGRVQGFIHPRWLFGISEPSTVSFNTDKFIRGNWWSFMATGREKVTFNFHNLKHKLFRMVFLSNSIRLRNQKARSISDVKNSRFLSTSRAVDFSLKLLEARCLQYRHCCWFPKAKQCYKTSQSPKKNRFIALTATFTSLLRWPAISSISSQFNLTKNNKSIFCWNLFFEPNQTTLALKYIIQGTNDHISPTSPPGTFEDDEKILFPTWDMFSRALQGTLSPQVALWKSPQTPWLLLHRRQAIQWPNWSLELKVNLRFMRGYIGIYIYIMKIPALQFFYIS